MTLTPALCLFGGNDRLNVSVDFAIFDERCLADSEGLDIAALHKNPELRMTYAKLDCGCFWSKKSFGHN